MIITGWCSICMYCLYQPFMQLWMKGNDEMMMSNLNMTLMCIYFYAINMTYVRSMYLDGRGLFRECRYWCIVEALANLVLNIVLGKLLGLTGVIMATIITIILFNFFGRSRILFKHYFIAGKGKFYLHHLFYIGVTVIAALLSKFVCEFIPLFGYWRLFFILVTCSLITIIVYLIAYFKLSVFSQSVQFFKRIVFRKNTK